MARLITYKPSGRIWPKPDASRTCGVIRSIDPDTRSGLINWVSYENNWQGQDVVFFAEDVFGDFAHFKQGHTVSFKLVNGIATLVCDIHNPDSEQALLDFQTAPAYA